MLCRNPVHGERLLVSILANSSHWSCSWQPASIMRHMTEEMIKITQVHHLTKTIWEVRSNNQLAEPGQHPEPWEMIINNPHFYAIKFGVICCAMVGNRNTSGEDTVDSSSLEWLWNICLTGIIVLSPSGSLCSCLCSPVILSWQPKSAFKNRIQTMSLLCWVASQLTQWKLQSPQWPTSVTCRVTLDLAS